MNLKSFMSLVILLTAAGAAASPLVDPFLEDLRVGRYATVDDLDPADGWPAGLFAPAHWSQAWERAWREVRVPSDTEAVVAALFEAAFASPDAQRIWLETRLRAWEARDNLAAEPDAHLSAAVLGKRALDQVAAGDPAAALATIGSLLSPSSANDLDALEHFVWSLRRRALRDRLGKESDSDRLWPELADLGPYDRNAGWAIWTLRRRYLGRPLLPDAPDDRDTVLFLASLRAPGLTSRDIDRSPYSRPLRAALGAAVLPRPSLRRHFGLYPDPPGDERLQEHWLRGRWRGLGYTTEAAERLAALPGLADEHRAGYLRRAADKQAADGYWGSVASNLRAALLTAERSGRRSVLRRVRTEIERIAALTAHLGRPRAAAVFEDLLALSPPVYPSGRLGRAERAVESGAAADARARRTLPDRDALRPALWRVWAKLGTRLLSDADSPDARWRDYGADLARVRADGRSPADVDSAGAQAVGRRLRDLTWRGTALDWMHASALMQAQDGALPTESTPLVGLVSATDSVLERHVILGLAIATRDARGQLAATVSLPRPGLGEDENLLLLYPTPWTALEAIRDGNADVDPALVLAVARNESLFDPAVRSRSGALGWMQIMPFHYPGGGHHGGEAVWRSLAASLAAGLRILESGIDRYDGDPYRTLAAYNAGPGAVARWDGQLGAGAPTATFLAWIGYPETRRYVEKVLIDRRIYAWILDGAEGLVRSAPSSR